MLDGLEMPRYSTKFNESQGPGTHRHDSCKGFLPWNESLSQAFPRLGMEPADNATSVGVRDTLYCTFRARVSWQLAFQQRQ